MVHVPVRCGWLILCLVPYTLCSCTGRHGPVSVTGAVMWVAGCGLERAAGLRLMASYLELAQCPGRMDGQTHKMTCMTHYVGFY